MNYYEHHIGDYAEATAHLTFVEDAAYSRMIRKYYATEKPLPSDAKAIQRLIGARTKEEKEAVETVLQEFFTLQDDGWHQTRCDEVIKRYMEKSGKARASAQARWTKPDSSRTADAMRTHGNNNANALPTDSERSAKASETHDVRNALQSPATNLQSPIPSNQVSETRDGDEIWSDIRDAYPLMSGRQDWITAQVHATNLVNDGHVKWFDLLAGVIRYREYVDACGKQGSEFVMNPCNFFRAVDRPWAQEWKKPAVIKSKTDDRRKLLAALPTADEIDAQERAREMANAQH